MKQNQINREVAKATGESVKLIRKRGFGIVIVPRRWVRPRVNGGQAAIKQPKPVKDAVQPTKAA